MKRLSLLFFSTVLLFSCTEEADLAKPDKQNVLTAKDSLKRRGGDGLYDVLGQGYNVTGDYANANSSRFQVIDLVKVKNLAPTRLYDEYPFAQNYKENYGENAKTYAETLTRKVFATATLGLFGATLDQSTVDTNTYDNKYIYGSYDLTIQQKRVRVSGSATTLRSYLTDTFIEDVDNSEPAEIVQDYGTHVMTDIYTGAKLETLFRAQTTNSNRNLAANSLVKANYGTAFTVSLTNNQTISDDAKNFDKKIFYKTRGGNSNLAITGSIDLNITGTPALAINTWQQSSSIANSVLVDFPPSGLKLIYEFIADPVKRAAVKAYVDQYLIDNSVKVTVSPPATALISRDENYTTTGFGVNLLPGNYTKAQLTAKGILDDQITSVKIPEGYEIILYENGDFTGRTFTSLVSVPNLTTKTFTFGAFNLSVANWNDRASSLVFRIKQ